MYLLNILKLLRGKVTVTTVYDLIMAQYGIDRGLGGDYPKILRRERSSLYACLAGNTNRNWYPRYCSCNLHANGHGQLKPQMENACIIIGAGINHWYHNNLIYRAGTMALNAHRLYWGEWWRNEPLCWSGETGTHGFMG